MIIDDEEPVSPPTIEKVSLTHKVAPH
jgi:NAD-dependent DNA ligase